MIRLFLSQIKNVLSTVDFIYYIILFENFTFGSFGAAGGLGDGEWPRFEVKTGEGISGVFSGCDSTWTTVSAYVKCNVDKMKFGWKIIFMYIYSNILILTNWRKIMQVFHLVGCHLNISAIELTCTTGISVRFLKYI